MPPVVHRDDVEPREVAEGDIAFTRRRLGAAAGARRIGLSHYVVPAGARHMPVHVHGDEEEIFFVLAGDGLGYEKGEAYEIAAGDVIVHRPNGKPHTRLAGTAELELLAFGSGSETSLTFLPRARTMWAGPRWVPVDGPHPFKAEGLAGALERPQPGPRPPHVVALDDVEVVEFPGARVRMAGAAARSAQAGLNHVTLEPGAAGAPAHCHMLEEEIFYVLEGSGTLRLGSTDHPLTPGDVVARPPGTGIAHTLHAGDGGLTYLVYGTREPGDIVHYPETGQVWLRGLGVRLDVS